MSTDDLTARARKWATQPLLHEHYGAALVSELADEVDRLRDENDALNDAVSNNYGHALTMQDLTAERDAARAALERVRAIIAHGRPIGDEAHGVIKEIRAELEKS